MSELPIKVEDRELLTLADRTESAHNAMIYWTKRFQKEHKAFWSKVGETYDTIDVKTKAYSWDSEKREITDPFAERLK